MTATHYKIDIQSALNPPLKLQPTLALLNLTRANLANSFPPPGYTPVKQAELSPESALGSRSARAGLQQLSNENLSPVHVNSQKSRSIYGRLNELEDKTSDLNETVIKQKQRIKKLEQSLEKMNAQLETQTTLLALKTARNNAAATTAVALPFREFPEPPPLIYVRQLPSDNPPARRRSYSRSNRWDHKPDSPQSVKSDNATSISPNYPISSGAHPNNPSAPVRPRSPVPLDIRPAPKSSSRWCCLFRSSAAVMPASKMQHSANENSGSARSTRESQFK